jgi:hypothetical protein
MSEGHAWDCLDSLVMLVGFPLLVWLCMFPFKWEIRRMNKKYGWEPDE